MLTRRHLRIKVMQSLYSFFQNEENDLNKEISFFKESFLNTFSLYITILSFLKDKNSVASRVKTRITNRCVLNNRGRGVLRPYGISRTLLRELMQFGVIPGYSKAVW